jgi:hypothetical protein
MADFKELKRIYKIEIPNLDQMIEKVKSLNATIVQLQGSISKMGKLVNMTPQDIKMLSDAEAGMKKLNGEHKIASRETQVLTAATIKQTDASKEEIKTIVQGEKARLNELRVQKLAIDIKLQQEKADYARTKSLIAQEKELERMIILEEQQKSKAAVAPVISTSNIASLEAQRLAAEKTGIVVNDLEKAQADAAMSANEWAAAQKKVTPELNANKKSSADLARIQQQNIKIAAEEKFLSAQRTAALKNQVREENAVKGSLEQRRAALIRLNAVYDNQSPTERASGAGQRLQKITAGLTAQVKELEIESGRAQRNVGNYPQAVKNTNAFTGALSKAWGMLRYITYILPGIGIAGALAFIASPVIKWAESIFGASEASKKLQEKLQKQKEALVSLIDSFRTYSDIKDDAFGSVASEISKVQTLAGVVLNQANSYEQRNAALKQLAEINKNYFGDLTLEQSSLRTLTGLVNEYTNALINQAVIKEVESDIGKVGAAYYKQIRAIDDAKKALKSFQAAQAEANKEFVAQNNEKNVRSFVIGTKQEAVTLALLTGEVEKQQVALRPLETQFNALKTSLQNLNIESLNFKPLGGTEDDIKSVTKLKAITEKFFSDELKDQAAGYKKLSEIDTLEQSTRIKAREDAAAIEKQIIEGQRNVELQNEIDKFNAVKNQKKVTANDLINATNELNKSIKEINQKADQGLLELARKTQDDLITIKQDSIGNQQALDKKYNEDTLAGFDKIEKAKVKIAKDAFDKAVTDISKEESDKITELAVQLEQKINDIIKSKKTPKQKEKDLTEVRRGAQVSVLDIEIEIQKRTVELYKKAREQNIITEEQYNAQLKKLADMRIERSEKEVKRLVDLEKYKDEARRAVVQGGEQLLQSFMTDTFDAQQKRLDKENEVANQRLDREKEQMLLRAQSAQEQDNIEKQFAAKKQQQEKIAFERNKKQKIKEIAIEAAFGAAKAIAQNPPPSPVGIIAALFVALTAAAQIANIAKQTFAKGGKIFPELSAGRITAKPNVRPLANGDNVLAYVKPGEVILNQEQQRKLGGDETFRRLRVPGFYALGGRVPGDALRPPANPSSFLNAGSASMVTKEDFTNILATTNELIIATNNRIDRIAVVQDTRAAMSAQRKIVRNNLTGTL